jgi:hypothetical protein
MTATEVTAPSIGSQVARGLRWSFAGTLVARIGSFALGLALARLLTPADFGVFAVASAAMAFVMHVNDVGLIAATVQWRGELEEMAPTAATMAMSFSVVVYGLMWFIAPVLASVAHTPDATGVIRLLTTVILVDGATAVRSAALMRTFRQDKLIVANVAGLVVNAAVAISLAAAGAGAYSFAAGLVASFVVTGILVFVFAGLPIRVGFDRPIAGRLMRFGLPLAGSLGVEVVLLNADYIIIGHTRGEVPLGYYLLAFNISTWALGVLSSAVRYVSVAGFSRLSEVDAETLSAGVRRTLPLLVTGVVPIAALTAALAGPLTVVLYGACRCHEVGTLGEPRVGGRAGSGVARRHTSRRHPWYGDRPCADRVVRRLARCVLRAPQHRSPPQADQAHPLAHVARRRMRRTVGDDDLPHGGSPFAPAAAGRRGDRHGRLRGCRLRTDEDSSAAADDPATSETRCPSVT